MKTRAERRHQAQRASDRARRVVRIWSRSLSPAFCLPPAEHARWVERTVRQLASDRKPCSCKMCCNPRRRDGELSVQERRVFAGESR